MFLVVCNRKQTAQSAINRTVATYEMAKRMKHRVLPAVIFINRTCIYDAQTLEF